jgi:predicted RNase H-like HicB family nuclease
MKIKIVFIPGEDGGYTVYAPSIQGCISQGDTKQEAIANIKEAIELSLEPIDEQLNLETDAFIEEIEF